VENRGSDDRQNSCRGATEVSSVEPDQSLPPRLDTRSSRPEFVDQMGVLDDIIGSHSVVVFSSKSCPHCRNAIRALQRASLEPFVTEVTAAQRGLLLRRTGWRFVPNVWVAGTFVGGWNDGPQSWMGVRPMLAAGTLQDMVKRSQPTANRSGDATQSLPGRAGRSGSRSQPRGDAQEGQSPDGAGRQTFPGQLQAAVSTGATTPLSVVETGPSEEAVVAPLPAAGPMPSAAHGAADVSESQEDHCGENCCSICFLEFGGERYPVQKPCCRNEVCNECYEKSKSRMCFFCRHDSPSWPALQPPAPSVEARRADIVAQQDAIALARAEQERHLERQRLAWEAIQNSQGPTAQAAAGAAPVARQAPAPRPAFPRGGRAPVPRVSGFIYGAQLEILEGLGGDAAVCKDLLLNHSGDLQKCVNDLAMLGVIDAAVVDSQPRQSAKKRTTLDVVNSRLGGSKNKAPEKSRARVAAASAVVHRPVPAFVYGVQLADLLDRGYDEELCRDLLAQYQGSLPAVLSMLSELGIAPQRRGPR